MSRRYAAASPDQGRSSPCGAAAGCSWWSQATRAGGSGGESGERSLCFARVMMAAVPAAAFAGCAVAMSLRESPARVHPPSSQEAAAAALLFEFLGPLRHFGPGLSLSRGDCHH